MAIGTTDIKLRDSLYVEMGKGTGGTNYSLYKCRYGQNDIGISTYAAGNPDKTNMGYWSGYSQLNMQFRVNGNQTMDYDTYADTTANNFNGGTGIAFNNNGANVNTYWYEFDGGSAQANFSAVSSGTAYKIGAAGTGVIAFWVYPQDNSSGQTTVLGNDVPLGSVSSYRGYRFDITTAMKIRVIRGDGTGIASSDRRTFESTGTLTQDTWNFFAFQGTYNSTTMSTSANYFWVYDGSSWTNGGSFLSGTGGNTTYGSTDGLGLSTAGNGGWYFQGSIGGIYAFDQSLTTTNVEDLYLNTRSVYP